MHDLGLGIGYAVGHGKYVLTDRLGEGGMAEVWGAINQRTMSPVALKFQRANPHSDPRERIRFFREAKHTIAHEHIVRIYDVDELNEHVPFLVMERLYGQTLRGQLRAYGALKLAQTANIITQVVSAIANIHSVQIVHRDLKPGNIMLLERPDGGDFAKVIDFGIAKSLRLSAHETTDWQLTRTDAVVGTVGYMAPEQAMGVKEIGYAADVWALGVILYECLSGRRLWTNAENDEFKVSAYMNASRTVESAIAMLGDVAPSEVREVIRGALRVEPDERISLAEMFDTVAKYALVRVPMISSPKIATRQDENGGDETKTHSCVQFDVPQRRRQRVPDVPAKSLESPGVVDKDEAAGQRPLPVVWLGQDKRAGGLLRRPLISHVAVVGACLGVTGFGIVLPRDVLHKDKPEHQGMPSLNESATLHAGDDFDDHVFVEEEFTPMTQPHRAEQHSRKSSSRTRVIEGKSSMSERVPGHHQKLNKSTTSAAEQPTRLPSHEAPVPEIRHKPNILGMPLQDSPLAAAIQTRKVP